MKRLIFLALVSCGQMWAALLTVRPGFDEQATQNLFSAVGSNDLQGVECAIVAGADVKAVDNYGYTLLHWAAEKNAKDAIELLIAADADVRAVDIFRHTPLHRAAKRNAKDAIELLIAKGANVKAVDHNGYTPLHEAAMRNAKDAAKVLLEYGAEIPYGLMDREIRFLDSVIKEINKERLAEEEALFAFSHLRAGDTPNPKRNMNAFILKRLYKPQLPLASEVVAQRKAAKQLQKVGKGMKARKELNELRLHDGVK